MKLFDSLMQHDVTLIKQDEDYTGSLTDAEEYEEKGFVQYGSKRMVDTDGEEITATGIVFLGNDSNYDPNHPHWKVTHRGREMKVKAPEEIDDPRTGNTHHYELGVQ